MPKAIHKMTARAVEKLDQPGRYSDGGNLYVSINANGGKRWVFLYRLNGRQREMGLGSAGPAGVTLARARELAAEARVLLNERKDPLEFKRRREQEDRPVPTFGDWADQYIETHRHSWRNDKHVAQWVMTLETYCASIRSIPVRDINTDDVLSVLKPIWNEKPETAKRLRGRIENVLDAATSKGYRTDENPARWKGHLKNLLPKPQQLSRGHHAALPYLELPAFMIELAKRSSTAARALEVTILTAGRTGEVLGATWDEIDLEKKLWTIPAARMKSDREHRVPLSEKAIELLQSLPRDTRSDLIFPGTKPNKPLSSMAMTMQLRRLNRSDITVHGFRSTFRDWASETTSFPNDVCELALAHAIRNKTEAAYRRGDLLDKRVKLMNAWTDHCMQYVETNGSKS